MASSRGKAGQENPGKDQLSRSRQPVGEPERCPQPTTLVIFCFRSYDLEEIGGLNVRITQSNITSLERTTKNKTGRADFGEVSVGDYQYHVDLNEDQAKMYSEVPSETFKVNKGDNRIDVFVEPIRWRLRVIPIDRTDQPLRNCPWKFYGYQTMRGRSNAAGLIEIQNVPRTETLPSSLEIQWRDRPQIELPVVVEPSKVSVTSPPVYPRPVDPASFTDDKNEKASVPLEKDLEKDDWVVWHLTVKDLEDDYDGLLARLQNLGFIYPKDSDSEEFLQAYNIFKEKYQVKGSVPDHIKSRHDEP